jgi:hypothetical protein
MSAYEIVAACAKSVPEPSIQISGFWSDLFFTYAEPAAATFSALTAVLAIVIAIFVNRSSKQHMKEEKRSWGVQRFTYLHEFLSDERYAKARYRLRKARKNGETYNPNEHDDPMDTVCACYDQAGLILLDADYIEDFDRSKFLKSSWGNSIIEQYEIIRQFEIEREAANGGNAPNPYSTQDFFEHFRNLYDKTCEVRGYKRVQGR